MSGVAEGLSKMRTENGTTIDFSNIVVTVNFENHGENDVQLERNEDKMRG